MKKRHKTIRKWPIEKTGAKNVPSLLSESLKQATSRPKRNHIKWVVLGEGGGGMSGTEPGKLCAMKCYQSIKQDLTDKFWGILLKRAWWL